MRRLFLLFLSALTLIAVGAAPASAVEADEVAAEAANTGFYVEPGSSISQEQAGVLVSEMRNAGEGFILVVLSEEPAAGATTFADNVQFAIGRGIVLVVSPETVGYAGEGEVFNEVELENALDVAIATGDTDFELAAAFVSQLTGVPISTNEPVPVPSTALTTPTVAPQAQAPASGGGNGFLWFIIIVGGLGLLVWWLMRRAKSKEATDDDGKLGKARYLIQEQLNDVANDILALEDEVRVADNDRASDFYNEAGDTYNDASESLPKANSAESLLDLSNRLDVAIWQLDSAEAILDDKPLPPRPEPKRLEPAATSSPTSSAPSGRTVPGPSSYNRRPTRQSSIGGGGIMDLLIAVGGGMLANRSRSSRSGGGGLGDLFNRRSQPQAPPRSNVPPPSSSGQSNPVPGPGRPATPSQSRSTMPKPTRRGTSGRVRSGRKRRRK